MHTYSIFNWLSPWKTFPGNAAKLLWCKSLFNFKRENNYSYICTALLLVREGIYSLMHLLSCPIPEQSEDIVS